MSLKIENNIIFLKKDCKCCVHLKVCKFHSKMSDLCNSNEFYGMNEYLEWNNSLAAFELNASCQYFKREYDIPEDGSLNLDIDEKIIEEIIRLERPKENLSTWSTYINADNVEFKLTTGEIINMKITDLLSKYKFN